MLEALRLSIVINFSITLNSWIYFLKRIPIVKIIFKDVGYEYSEISKALYPIGLLYNMLKQLLKSILLLGLSFGLLYLIMYEDIKSLNMDKIYWHVFIIFYVLLTLPNSKILEPHKRKFIAVKLMRMNARRFVISDYFPHLILRQIVELVPFMIVARLFHANMVLALFMIIAKNFFAIFAEALQIKYYDKTGNLLNNKVMISLIYSLVVLGIGYYSTLNQYILVLSNQLVFIMGAILCMIGLFSIRYIMQYDKFSAAINDANQLDKLNIDVKSVKKNAEFSRVKFKDKEFTREELQYDKSNLKEGFAYINEIFFKRHKRILNGPIKVQVFAIILLFVIGIVSSFLIPNFNQEYVKGIKKVFPVFIFALYMMSTGQKATKAMFYNCDISLLHYGFYKTSEAVLATFTIRAKYLIISNLIPAASLALGVVLLDVITGGSIMNLVPIGIMILVISIFFVIHNLFLYYIFQPYTTDLTVKNPFYKFFNFITYLLSYLCLQLENMSITFLIIVIAVTLIYSIAALMTVYRVAPRTFMIK